jgi:DNA-binding CsgD family transcriptional regulator
VLPANSNTARLLVTLAFGHADPVSPVAGPDRKRFLAALERACAGRLGVWQYRFDLPRQSGNWPLIAELTHADPALAGPGTALVVLTDPMSSPTIEDPSVLQLLGLTPAEARIAAVVGAGLSPREAALWLGLQQSTVRSALKLIYNKLDVRRQTELALIVARL